MSRSCLAMMALWSMVGCFPEIKLGGDTAGDTGSPGIGDTSDSAVNPCDGGDQNADLDADGYSPTEGDCDDCNAAVGPDAEELCDSVDNDCDGSINNDAVDAQTWYADADQDGWGVDLYTMSSCEAPAGYAALSGDCDDANAAVNPGAEEYCDSVDNDCDGSIDSDAVDAQTWYADADQDGFGDEPVPTDSCSQPSGYVSQDTDCDDTDPGINPGAVEVCDAGVDNDCDGLTDDKDTGSAVGNVDASTYSTWYLDGDSDGFGDSATVVSACEAPSGYSANQTDCDDTDPSVNPAAAEVCADGVDNDCDASNDATGSTWYLDADSDGYGDSASSTSSCSQPSGWVLDSADCDDTDADVNPGATELCDSADNDCDGISDEPDAVDASTWYQDADSDGWGNLASSTSSCSQPSGYVVDDTDCDDTDADVNPGATELCDSADNDCDGTSDEPDAVDAGTWYQDADSDGYGDPAVSATACTAPAGYVSKSGDCDDSDASVFGGNTEVCDSADNDCDGSTDEDVTTTYYLDSDGDGWGLSSSTTQDCSVPSSYAESSGDCNDADASVSPGATEVCDSVDNDCDGTSDEGVTTTYYLDSDGDGYGVSTTTQEDCEEPTGYIDNNEDCDDANVSVNPDGIEYDFVLDPTSSNYLVEVNNCGDGVDNNCDGDRDSSDWNCSDEDSDGIYNGADPYIGGYDLDTDGIEELCGLAENLFEPEWTMSDVIVQVDGTWTSVSTAAVVTLMSITVSGVSVEAWCYEPTSSGTGYAGYVSTTGVDGSSAVDTSDCSDWVRPISDVCDMYGDHYCEPYYSSDGCSTIGNRAFDWSLSSGGVISSN